MQRSVMSIFQHMSIFPCPGKNFCYLLCEMSQFVDFLLIVLLIFFFDYIGS